MTLATPDAATTTDAAPVRQRIVPRAVRTALLALTCALLVPGALPPDARAVTSTASTGSGWVAPVPGELVRPVSLPARPWLPGHRGVDLAAAAGTAVVAPSAGTVTFAGQVAGRGVVVVAHGTLRSTFEPVDADVPVGTVVAAGDPVAVVSTAATGHCAPASCLHWGVRRDETYLDPMALLGRAEPIVLLPSG